MEEVFRYDNLFKYGLKCCRGVIWKQSVQNFKGSLFSMTAVRRHQLLEGRWKQGKGARFMVRERGYAREINASLIKDRQVHKTLVHEALIPLYRPSVIKDNGASQKGKGLHFHFKELEDQLRWHYQRFGRQGGVLLLDYSKFFPSVPHKGLYERHERYIPDTHIRKLSDDIIGFVPGGKGMHMGVELSQIEMVSYPSSIDHWLKCQLSLHSAAHYMDDYIIVHEDIEKLKEIRDEFIRRSEAIGLKVHPKKCQIIPLTKPFKFCKAKFQLTETGKVIVHGNRASLTRARRKLRKFKKFYEEGKITLDVPKQFVTSMEGYWGNFDDHGRVLEIRRMYHSLFEEWTTRPTPEDFPVAA